MLEEWQPVKLFGHWQVQSVTKLATSCKGMLKVSKVHAACNVIRFYEISHVKGVERNKNMQ